MPKSLINFSKTIVYKICCKDESICDLYVGHTTNFVKRKYFHQTSARNGSKKIKIYDIIRANGGWENWDMIEIAKYDCKNSKEAKLKERYHYMDLMNKILEKISNTYSSSQYLEKYHIDDADDSSDILSEYSFDIFEKKMEAISKPVGNSFSPKNAENADFSCIICDYICSKKSEWDRHINTKKHKYRHNGNILETNGNKKNAECECGKKYNTRSGLWKHQKICQEIKNSNENQIISLENNGAMSDKDLIVYLIKENSEFKNMMLEQQNMMMKVLENGTNNMNNSHNHSHNKTFNLQFFLNETCKDAMNIMDFVDSIKLQLSDAINVGEVGYIEGISNIITKNLKQLDITQRPIHCTDKKRETIYIKDEDKWEKEEENNPKMRKVIRHVSHKNAKMLPEYRAKYPDCGFSHSNRSDQYNKMIIEAMGGSGNNDIEKEDKIIRNVMKDVCIDKSKYLH